MCETQKSASGAAVFEKAMLELLQNKLSVASGANEAFANAVQPIVDKHFATKK